MAAVGTSLVQRVTNLVSYRGREGQWSWLIHRVAGVGILAFLYLHIWDIWLMGLGRQEFERFLFLYRHPFFKMLEVLLIFGVLFHAVNGARIILIDFWPGATRHQRKLVWIETAIMLVVLVPTVWVTVRGMFR